MKDNRNILNEAFFKKASYEEKRDKRLPQYAPVDLKQSSKYTSNTVVPGAAYQVTDTDEVKRRLAGAFGVTFGNNNVRSMASRAIKEFPILISDSVEPETALMVKKLVEEQYAEYINLLISNQVVNLADYRAGDEEGNIAIQALDSISGSDFRRSRIADKAAKAGNIDADTVFQNVPLYNLLRENQMELKTGDVITDTLLENAIVIPSSEVEKLIEFLDFNSEEIAMLNEATDTENDKKLSARDSFRFMTDDDYGTDNSTKITNTDKTIDSKRGFMGLDDTGKEIYNKLTTGDIVLDEKRFDQALNRTVGEMLLRPENKEIRDKFEKATFLLQSRRISGLEYHQYLTLRLGIPVSDSARLQLVSKYKIAEVRKYGMGRDLDDTLKNGSISSANVISPAEVKAIASNRRHTEKVVKGILDVKLKTVLGIAGAGIGAGLTVGGVIHAAEIWGWLSASIFNPIIVGACVSGAVILGLLIHKMKKKKQKELENLTKIAGWERVEQLIEEMELQQASIRNRYSSIRNEFERKENDRKYLESKMRTLSNDKIDEKYNQSVNNLRNIKTQLSTGSKPIYDTNNKIVGSEIITSVEKDYVNEISETNKMISKYLRESEEIEERITFNEFFKNLSNEYYTILQEAAYEVAIENQNDPHLRAEILTEKTLAKTTMPMTVKYVEKKDNKDILVTPSFMARDNYAYGSVEIDRKALKDRRYNQPLIMTIKFKERFNDEKYTDNELTAVIGILGKIVRIPSSEMQYILQQSAEGKTIEGIFNGGDLKSAVEDMFSVSKISKDLKNLPQSADIWRNLEKVTTLAAANKISAKRNGNVSNAHIVFSQKEVDGVRMETGVDFLKDVKKSVALMKRYSAFTLMVANDAGQRMNILDDQDALSWNVLPYSALSNKDGGDQLNAALTKMMRL